MIVIDAGHGGSDPGCSGGGLVEKDLTFRLATFIQERAAARGMHTALVRTGDLKMSLSERGKAARNLGARQVISLHFDSNPQPSVGRTTFYVRADDAVSEGLAEAIGKRVPQQLAPKPLVVATSPIDWRVRAHNVVSAYQPTSALLIEWAFLSNPRHVTYLTTPSAFASIADATLAGILEAESAIVAPSPTATEVF